MRTPATAWQAGPYGAPLSLTRPLIFHRVSSLGTGHAADLALAALIEQDAALGPTSARAAWPAAGAVARHATGIEAYDVEAGDDRFVFFTPGMPLGDPFDGEPTPHLPVLAFELSDVQARGRAGWRARDFVQVYKNGFTNEDWDAWRIPTADERRRFAESATLWEADKVRLLVTQEAALWKWLHARCCDPVTGEFVGPEYRVDTSQVLTELRRALGDRWAKSWAGQVLGPYQRKLFDWEAPARRDLDDLEAWFRNDWRPEVVVEAAVPLSLARYVRRADGWHLLDGTNPWILRDFLEGKR